MKADIIYNDDQALMNALKAGNISALEQFYESHYKHLWGFAKRIVNDPVQAEDIVANVFVKIWENHHRFDIYKALLSYAYLIVRNSCIDYLKFKRRQVKKHREAEYLADKMDEIIDTELIRTQLMHLCILEIDTLPTRQKEVIKLCFIEGLSYDNIAKKMGISINTMKSQKQKALKRLRVILKDKGVSPALLLLIL